MQTCDAKEVCHRRFPLTYHQCSVFEALGLHVLVATSLLLPSHRRAAIHAPVNRREEASRSCSRARLSSPFIKNIHKFPNAKEKGDANTDAARCLSQNDFGLVIFGDACLRIDDIFVRRALLL